MLVADDEEAVRETARLALKREGFDVLLADNGPEAISTLLRGGTVELILLDLTMPVLSGPETLREIRALRPKVPIIVMSGYSEAEAVRQFGDAAFDAFLRKPFTVEELRAKVLTSLDGCRRLEVRNPAQVQRRRVSKVN